MNIECLDTSQPNIGDIQSPPAKTLTQPQKDRPSIKEIVAEEIQYYTAVVWQDDRTSVKTAIYHVTALGHSDAIQAIERYHPSGKVIFLCQGKHQNLV